MSAVSRRTVLAGLGGALGLPLLKIGRAAEVDPPHRVIFVFTEYGTYHDDWRMRFAGTPTASTAGWQANLAATPESAFSKILAPLARWRDRMIALDGMSLLSAMADPHGDSHARGRVATLTGAIASRGFGELRSFASQASLDQRIRAFLRANDPTLTDLTSLELAISQIGSPVDGLSYDMGSDALPYRVPWEIDPAATFDLLYPAAASDPLVQGRSRVLDRLHQQYTALSGTLSGDDRARIDLHRDLLSDVVRRVDLLETGVCGDPFARPSTQLASWDGNYGDLMSYQRDNFIDLLVQAMACGVTRVATLTMSPPPLDLLGGRGDFHADYTHQVAPGAPREKVDVVVGANQWYARMIDQLLATLQSVPEAGGTLLDSTTVVWVTDLGTGGHDLSPYNACVFGGARSPFALGRYVRFGQVVPAPTGPSAGLLVGPAHNHLLVSIAQAMGMPDDHIGERSVHSNWSDGRGVEIGVTGRLAALYG